MPSRRPLLTATTLALVTSACVFPVERTTEEIVPRETLSISELGETIEVGVYRNEAYRCGRSGFFTFVVIEPIGAPGGRAPLWIYLRGGGVGYYGEDGVYRGRESVNDEEPGLSLYERVRSHVIDGNGEIKDTVLARRVLEGYRILAPSMCDHDLHAGLGTREYPNNPNFDTDDPDTVDGLAANLAALEYVAEHYPTTHAFVHGTSAGSVGAWALSYALAREDVELTGALLDSFLVTDRLEPLFEAEVSPLQAAEPDFDLDAVRAKIGPFVTNSLYHADRRVTEGFDAVPLFNVVGELDKHCAGHLDPLPEVAAAGYDNNCGYVYGALADAVAGQAGSPHVVRIERGAGHVVTSDEGPWTDVIDTWLHAILAGDPPHPLEGLGG